MVPPALKAQSHYHVPLINNIAQPSRIVGIRVVETESANLILEVDISLSCREKSIARILRTGWFAML